MEYTIISNEEEFEKTLKIIEKYNSFSYIIQTNSLNMISNRITGFSFSVIPNQVFYIPILKNNILSFKIHYSNIFFKKIKNLFENKNQLKIGYDIKKNYHLLNHYNIQLSGNEFDTMIASYVLNNTHKKNENISDLYNLWIDKFSKNKKENNEKKIIGIESDINLKLYIKMSVQLNQENTTKAILEKIEIPLIKVIANIEKNGVLIDVYRLKKQSEKINLKLLKLQKNAYQLTGLPFNILSVKQLKIMLIFIKNKNNILSNIKKENSLLNIVKEYRSLYKLKSTYIDTLPKKINIKTGRIHTCYHQANTTTGRLSSTNPNLQNIPSKTKEGKYIRKAFIASDNYYLVSADYSQIELRILAHLSQDKKLIQLFSNNSDIHQITASEIFHTPITEITNEQRQSAKIINFSLIYGMKSFGLADKLKIDISKAKKYIKIYFERYKGISQYIQSTYQEALKKGYVKTLYGRKIYIPNITSKHFPTRKSAERTSINAPVQGTAADIIKLAMVKIYHCLKKNNLDAKIIMQVHDELVFEIKKEKINSICKEIRNIMENSTKLDIPININIKIGNNWKENIEYI